MAHTVEDSERENKLTHASFSLLFHSCLFQKCSSWKQWEYNNATFFKLTYLSLQKVYIVFLLIIFILFLFALNIFCFKNVLLQNCSIVMKNCPRFPFTQVIWFSCPVRHQCTHFGLYQQRWITIQWLLTMISTVLSRFVVSGGSTLNSGA